MRRGRGSYHRRAPLNGPGHPAAPCTQISNVLMKGRQFVANQREGGNGSNDKLLIGSANAQ